MAGYPKHFIYLLIFLAFLLFASGILLTPSVLLFRLEMEYNWLFDGPLSQLAQGGLRHAVTVTHAIAGWITVWFIGTLWTIHMRTHWRRNENRMNGAIFTLFWFMLIVSSLGIYYFGDPDWSFYSGMVHTGLGLMLPFGVWLHRLGGQHALAKS
ncbi:hypothetical protein QCB44_04350 [Thiomicrorhabdus sp. zzn3]|uniref:hypothetical protein n=1 Tax=Thiomicrorhabdus sp. zzn3 TaxID=3039775 RepID=UPI002436D9AF|nr:hypothetical protein [Thiomicrorhabdus sp. zzn3]MDG6777934.1 hypothetical protein [Thiomicrorhabdus sp. zzn3]